MTITWKGSPNFDSNRTPIDRIVIHWFGVGTLEGANTMFQKAGGTSAHYGISDDRVWQWVKEEHVAYHAGNYAMNQRSIGIEHDANPEKPLSEASYQTSATLIREICNRYNIIPNRQTIIKHSEVKATQCPGTIDLDKLIALVKGNMSQVTLDSAKFEELVNKSSRLDEFTKAGYTSPAEIQKQFDDYKKALQDKQAVIDVLEIKADELRKTLNGLIASCAKALNTVQEVEQIKGSLLLVEKQLDDLDDLQRNYGELQLHSAKQVEDLNVEITRLQEIIKQQGYLEGLTDYEFIRQILKDLVRRLKAFIK
jgi:N-acetyl-anhydromuramyl-L-alanine amidase AmpD